MKLTELFIGLYKKFPISISNFKKVKYLHLVSENDIDKLILFSDQLHKLTKINELFIHAQIFYFKKLPSEIGDLKTLKKLKILNYPFTEFPSWIFKLENLEELFIRGNDLEIFPEELSKLPKLKSLSIENCDIKVVPEGLVNLKNLKYLSFKATTIEEVSFDKLPMNLKKLNLNWCLKLNQEIYNQKTKFKIIK